MKFRIACTNHHHHHFICESVEIQGNNIIVDRLIKLSLPGVNIHKHKLEVYGVCESCQD